jgi:FtsP/CotA-like multicopper oxidase with cupredoxin domain
MSQRREFFKHLTTLGAAFWAGAKTAYAQQHDHTNHSQQPNPSGQPAGVEQGVARGKTQPPTTTGQKRPAFNVPIETPDLPKLPFKMVDGWKEFHLVAEPVRFEIVPGRYVDAWGYNGSVPGPTLEVNQGDKVRVIFENKLPEPSAVHWHGFEVPMEMDGSVGLGQDPVPPGGKFVYEWELHQAGTFFYHSHMPMQEMMGLIGLFIMYPEKPYEPHCDRDFGIVLQEWALLPNNTVPNTLSMEFNWLTFNGKSGPATTPMIVKQGERVRIRMINIGMDHHPIHLHGHQFVVTGTEGGRGPVDGWVNQNTVIVGVAQARDIEFDAKYLGDWMLHCHLPHHMMNQMVSMVGPLSHGAHSHGIGTGAGMEEGMGIVTQGDALSGELGPSLGRGLGMAADSDRSTSNLVGAGAVFAQLSGEDYTCPHHPEVRQKTPGICPKCKMTLVKGSTLTGQHEGHAAGGAQPPAGTGHAGHGAQGQGTPTGHTGQNGVEPFDPMKDMYPKDDPAKKKVPGYPQDMWMVEDEKYAKPETYGLRRGWTGAMMGMMTIVRIVTPEVYDKIMDLKAEAAQNPKPKTQAAPHQHQH